MDIEKILNQMTLEDKIALCSGANFWETKKFEKYGIPSLFMCDGPHGLRKQEDAADMLGVNASRPATCFPAEVTTAGSWNPELLTEIGAAIGEEAMEQGVGLVLGPGANLKRNPLCGRNFEYFSEDPFLAGKLAAGFIRGAEAQGISTSLKHFAANSQEKSRFNSDSVLDERTLRELYLTAFEIAVKEGKPSTGLPGGLRSEYARRQRLLGKRGLAGGQGWQIAGKLRGRQRPPGAEAGVPGGGNAARKSSLRLRSPSCPRQTRGSGGRCAAEKRGRHSAAEAGCEDRRHRRDGKEPTPSGSGLQPHQSHRAFPAAGLPAGCHLCPRL